MDNQAEASREIPTPQTVSSPVLPSQNVEYSGVSRRIVAYLIDSVIIVFPIMLFITAPLLASGNKSVGELESNLASAFMGLVFIIYKSYCEAKWGKTLGKKITGLKVVNTNGTKVDTKTAIFRNILLIADNALGIIALLIMIFTAKKQRVGDIVANTVVVVGK